MHESSVFVKQKYFNETFIQIAAVLAKVIAAMKISIGNFIRKPKDNGNKNIKPT